MIAKKASKRREQSRTRKLKDRRRWNNGNKRKQNPKLHQHFTLQTISRTDDPSEITSHRSQTHADCSPRVHAITICVNVALWIGAISIFASLFKSCDKSYSAKDLSLQEFFMTEYDKISNPNHPCGVSEVKPNLKRGRIVGGAEAVPNSWPYTVGLGVMVLQEKNQVFIMMHCGATLISSRNALTAAHCFIEDQALQNSYSVLTSFHSRDTFAGLKPMRVAVIRFHPQTNVFENKKNLIYDIALLTLLEEFTPTREIEIACLPSIRKELPAGTLCWATGWGNTNGTGSDKLLKQVVLDIVSEKRCREEFNPFIETKSTLCAGTTPGQDTCQGDSGGPLYYQDDGKWVVYGVTSYGFECGRGPMAAYATVSYQMGWLCCFMSNLPTCKDIRCIKNGEN